MTVATFRVEKTKHRHTREFFDECTRCDPVDGRTPTEREGGVCVSYAAASRDRPPDLRLATLSSYPHHPLSLYVLLLPNSGIF